MLDQSEHLKDLKKKKTWKKQKRLEKRPMKFRDKHSLKTLLTVISIKTEVSRPSRYMK